MDASGDGEQDLKEGRSLTWKNKCFSVHQSSRCKSVLCDQCFYTRFEVIKEGVGGAIGVAGNQKTPQALLWLIGNMIN